MSVRQGSVTVFATLSLLLVASFLLALLEAARIHGLEAYSRMHRVNAMESVLSEYQRDLFDKYGIFLLDGAYGAETLQFSRINERLQSVSQKNLRPVIPAQTWRNVQNFYQMDVEETSVSGYLLATDEDGAPFRHMAAESMKAQYPVELIKTMYDGLQSANHAMNEAQASQSAMDEAQENIQAARERQEKEAAETGESEEDQTQETAGEPVENPMDVVRSFKKADILTLVLPSGSRVSTKAISRDVLRNPMLEHRVLLQGNEPWQDTGGWYETMLYQKFLQVNFGCYGTVHSADGVLDYELEYIHAGKLSDRENLRSVVKDLLWLREGANFLYLQTDAVKREEAYALAASIAAAAGIIPATGLIAQGLLAAWAYAESILDVRTLLAGGKIPWMKTDGSWNSSLSGIGSLLAGSARAKEQEDGEDYVGYLQKLLYLKSARTLNYRAMDLMELYAHQCGNENLRMDAMIVSLWAELSYGAEPLFSKMVALQTLQTERFVFSETVYGSYEPDKK